MKKDKKSLHSISKLAFYNVMIGIVLALALYFLLPYILNYPPNTIDNDFQVQMVGIKYTYQYAILVTFLAISIFCAFKFSYRKLSLEKLKETDDKTKYIEKLRKNCFNYPYLTLIIQSCVPTIVCGILLITFNTNLELLLRICVVILSVCSIYAITSYMFNKKFFEDKLIKTFGYTKKSVSGIRLNIYKKLAIQTFPLFLYSSVVLLLITISVMTTEKGDLQYHLYRQELLSKFPQNQVYDIENVKNTLLNMDLSGDNDHIIILKDNGDVYFSEQPLNDFLVEYTLNYYDEMDGQIFEYYGQNIQSSVLKIHTTTGDYYIGIRFFVFSNDIFTPFIITVIGTILFNLFYIIYIGKGLSNDLNNIIAGMKNISNLDNILLAENLPTTSNDEIGDLTLEFNKIQDLTKKHVEQLQESQDKLMEGERLASLGQLIGGIAHNLKTPIMSISGAAEGLRDLIKEYDMSIGDSEVTQEDHHDIAKDMNTWVEKIKNYTEYMSDIISAVKGQAVTFTNNKNDTFTIDELIKRVDILMRHELKSALINLQVQLDVNSLTTLHGDVNSLVQVINNMISNSIQAYKGTPNKDINLIVSQDDTSIIVSIQDFAGGLPKDVQNKLFKEMITTKGKDGTGLGLFMSYSTIKAHFGGDITFKTEQNIGTTFNIILPKNNS